MAVNKKLFLVSHILTFIISLAMVFVLPFILSVAEYAKLMLLIALINFLVSTTSLSATPFIIRNYNLIDKLHFNLSKSIKVLFLVGMITSFFLLLVYSVLQYPIFNYISAVNVYLLVVSLSIGVVASGYYRAAHKAIDYFVVIAGNRLLLLALIFFWMMFFDSFNSEIYIALFLISSFIVLAAVRFRVFVPTNKNTLVGYREVFTFCIPLAITNSILMLMPLFERSVLTIFYSDNVVATFVFNLEVSMKVVAGVLVVLKVIVWPAIVSSDGVLERFNYKNNMSKITLLASVLLVISVVASIFLYDLILDYVGLGSYKNKSVFITSLFYAYLVVIGYMINISLMLTGSTKIVAYSSIIFVLLYSILVYFLSLSGVEIKYISIACVLSYLVGLIFSVVANLRYFRLVWQGA